MEFCKDCKNMIYLKIETRQNDKGIEEEMVINYCKQCGKEYKLQNTKQSLHSINLNVEDTIKKKKILNPYSIADPTLPIASGIRCPNKECPSKTTGYGAPTIKYMNYEL